MARADRLHTTAKILVVIGFCVILAWQALILFVAPKFMSLWHASEMDTLPWSTRLFGSLTVRWLVFALTGILLAILFAGAEYESSMA